MKRKRRSQTEINYWESNTDLMTGLVLVLLLIIALLLLYMMSLPQREGVDTNFGTNYNLDEKIGDTTRRGEEDDDDDSDDGGGHYYGGHYYGGGGGGGNGGDDSRGGGAIDIRGSVTTDVPDFELGRIVEDREADGDTGGGGNGSGAGNGMEGLFPYAAGGDNWAKAAVYTTVVDGESGRALHESGISFELYEEQRVGDGGAVRFLNTYYPQKIEYRTFETTERGVFYLPEKIEEGHFYFKQLTEVEGYDSIDRVPFDVDNDYDWPDPFVVSVRLFPSKNIVHVELEDLETHEPIDNGTFRVKAAEDIITIDDTLRYQQDELADTIEVNEDGKGNSKELFLGQYTVEQEQIPRYYVALDEGSAVQVRNKKLGEPATLRYLCEKTKIKVQLTDDFYPSVKLEGAEFVLSCENHPEFTQRATTNEHGELVFTNLEKNRTYKLRQLRTVGNYHFDERQESEIYVSDSGLIDGGAQAFLSLTNYVKRVHITASSAIFGNPVPDQSLALYNEGGELIRTWTTTAMPEILEDLPGGSYYVTVGGNDSKRFDFQFEDGLALQKFSVKLWTLQTIGILAGAAVLLLIIIILVVRSSKKSAKGGR